MKKISLKRKILVILSISFPLVAFAVEPGATNVASGIGSLAGLIQAFTDNVVKAAATLLLSLALLAFFWGIVEYIWAKRQGDGKGVKDGGDFMKWGLVALFVMFSVYGLIKVGQNIIAPGTDWATITIPDIRFKSGGSTTRPAGAGTGGAVDQGTVTRPAGGGGITQTPTVVTKKPNGYSCISSGDCTSGFCDPYDNTCTRVGGGGGGSTGLGEGVACTDTPQCASGLTCQGSNASNRVCTSGSSQATGLPDGSACSGSGRGPCAVGLECIEGQCLIP